jgi:hypothetical protein
MKLETLLPKRGVIRSKQYRDGARGQTCTLRIPGVCNSDPETVVFAHSNLLADGKGKGQKADDLFGCDACSACHAWLDSATGPAAITKRLMFDGAMKETMLRRIRQGLLMVVGAK